jgi:ribosomal protein S18 acetylase RimI-like enzyme
MTDTTMAERNHVQTSNGFCDWSHEGHYAHIYNLFVYTQFRGQKKAETILHLAIDQIREAGHQGEIRIVAAAENPDLEKRLASLYARLGLAVCEYYG